MRLRLRHRQPRPERIKLQQRQFYSLPAPKIATATTATERRKLVAKLESDDPVLYQRYHEVRASADAWLDSCRTAEHFLAIYGQLGEASR